MVQMAIELPFDPPSGAELDARLSEYLNVLRLTLSKDRRPGDGDLWAEMHEAFPPLSGDAEQVLRQLNDLMVGRFFAGVVAGAGLVNWVAELEGIEPGAVLDQLTLRMRWHDTGP